MPPVYVSGNQPDHGYDRTHHAADHQQTRAPLPGEFLFARRGQEHVSELAPEPRVDLSRDKRPAQELHQLA